MARIFLQFSVLIGALLLSGCNRNEIEKVDVPKDVAAVSEPFLAAIKKGDRAGAEKFVDRYAIDETRQQFAPAQADLEASGKLVPVSYRPKQGAFGINNNEATVVYMNRTGKDWITATVRLGRVKGEQFKVEHWDVLYSSGTPPVMEQANQVRWFMGYFMAGLAVLGLVALGLILWLLKRRPQIVAVDNPAERRAAATTTRDGE